MRASGVVSEAQGRGSDTSRIGRASRCISLTCSSLAHLFPAQELALMNSKGLCRQKAAAINNPGFNAGLRRTRMLNQPRAGF